MEDHEPRRRKSRIVLHSPRTISNGNLSSISTQSRTGIGRKSLSVTFPADFGATLSLDGRVLEINPGGAAHASGLLQVGDYVRILEHLEGYVRLSVTYGILEVDHRPSGPFVIEIGNRSSTPLGLALADFHQELKNSGALGRRTSMSESGRGHVRISSIQPGSLADRCGFLRVNDEIVSVTHLSEGQVQTVSISPFHTSSQVARLLRKLTQTATSVTMTVVPGLTSRRSSWDEEDSDIGSSTSTVGTLRTPPCSNSGQNESILSLCLWKDSSFDDWGFSIVDQHEIEGVDHETLPDEIATKTNSPSPVVHEIRPGGPAFLAGLRSGDKILQVSSELEFTEYQQHNSLLF